MGKAVIATVVLTVALMGCTYTWRAPDADNSAVNERESKTKGVEGVKAAQNKLEVETK
jgi:hypothetical protein